MDRYPPPRLLILFIEFLEHLRDFLKRSGKEVVNCFPRIWLMVKGKGDDNLRRKWFYFGFNRPSPFENIIVGDFTLALNFLHDIKQCRCQFSCNSRQLLKNKVLLLKFDGSVYHALPSGGEESVPMSSRKHLEMDDLSFQARRVQRCQKAIQCCRTSGN